LALVGAKIYLSPSESPIESGTVLVHGGHILSVGPIAEIEVPRAATVIDCKGLVVTAGFWNSHVHILLPGLVHAEKVPPDQITSQLQQMLTRWGFTTVFDIASVLKNTNLIRHLIESGEVKGPRILTVGEPFWMKGGTPIYIKGFLEANHLSIPEVESTSQAIERVRQQIRDGADGIKIFANSSERDATLTMPLELARAIAAEAHRAGKPVFAHVSNNQGTEVAIQGGVDILAHTTPTDELWSPSFVQRLTAAHMALTPTLTLWDVVSKQSNNSPEEIMWMSRSGMSFREILASLTTNPAQRFGYATQSGRIAKGLDGDLVVLGGDPAQNTSAFSRVLYTIRAGEVIYAGN
jgi:imidazolonepropionase-like amidohydrolase